MPAANRATLTAEANTNINDNTSGDVSPQDCRDLFNNIIDSCYNSLDDGTPISSSAVPDATTDSDAAGKLLYRDAAGALKQREFVASEVLVLSAAPVDGTTVAWRLGQLAWDRVAKNLYEATAVSTDPDAAGTGSTWAQVTLGGVSLGASIAVESDDQVGAVGASGDAAPVDHKHPAQAASVTLLDAGYAAAAGTVAASEDVNSAIQKLDGNIQAIPSPLQVPVALDVGGGATFGLPTGQVAGKFYVIQNANAAGTALGAANAITVNTGDKLAVSDGVTSSTDDGNDFVKFDNTDSVDSVTVGTGSAQTGATTIPVATTTTEGVVDGAMVGQITQQALVLGAAVGWDADSGNGATLDINAAVDPTLSAPVNLVAGEDYTLSIRNTSGADRTVTFNAVFIDSESTALVPVVVPTGQSRSWNFASPDGINLQQIGPASAEVLATLIDSSGGASVETLAAATGSRTVLFFANSDVQTNSATLAVQSGESLNGVTDGMFLFSNYADGTQFQAVDNGLGQWVVSVVGAPSATSLFYYSAKGCEIDRSFTAGVNVVDLNALVDSSLFDGEALVAAEYDPSGARSGSVVTIPNAGLYSVSIVVDHPEADIGGTAGQNTDNNRHGGIRVNGTDVEWLSIDNNAGLPDRMISPAHLRQFNAGDTVELVFDGDGAADEDLYVQLTIAQQPSESVVLAGTVVPQTLASAVYALSADSASAVVCPLDRGTGDTTVITNAAGTVTVPAGKYRIVAFATRHGAVLDYELYDVTNSASLKTYRVDGTSVESSGSTEPLYLTFSAPTDIQIRETNADFPVIWNGDESGNGVVYGCYLDIQQLPDSSVVNPGDVPVVDVDVVEYAETASLGFGPTYSLDNGRTWQNLIDDYEYLVFNYSIKVTGVTERALRTITVRASQWADATRFRFEYGSAIVDFNPGANTGGDFILSGATVDDITLEIVGRKAQQTVINSNDLAVSDQSASGYFDFGNMRMQWGVGTTGAIVFPAAFADTSYSVCLQPLVDDNSGTYSAQAHTLLTSGCSVNRNINNTVSIVAASFTYHWQAIGLKP